MRRAFIAVSTLFVTSLAACDENTAPRGPGAISVSSLASTVEPAFFQYGISIDNGTPRQAIANEALLFTQGGMAHGEHTVAVTSGLPTGCAGAASKTVSLRGDDTAAVIFSITCPRTTGDLTISAVTSGVDIDPDGYIASLNFQFVGLVPANGSVQLRFLPPGSYSVSLSNVATNCTTPSAQTVQITAGGNAQAAFTIQCSAQAVMRFVGSASGAERDPDGTVVEIGSILRRVPQAGIVDVSVPVGTRTYTLSDVQPNCTLAGPTSGSHTLAQGDTVVVNVDATCTTIDLGSVGVSMTDPAADTLGNGQQNPSRAHDIVGGTARYGGGFLILVTRFARPVKSPTTTDPDALYGYVDLDIDESMSTGVPPASNFFGGSAQMGSDFLIPMFEVDSVSTPIFRTPNVSTPPTFAGMVRFRVESDSLILFIPLNKIGDDGNLAATMVFGTADRPTDAAPNSNVYTLRVPASPTMALQAPAGRRTEPKYPPAPGRSAPAAGKWGRKD